MDHDGPTGSTTLRHRLWRPPANRDLVLGVALAVVLPLFAAFLVGDVPVFDRFPGLPFLIAAVSATLVGRLIASVVATAVSAALILVLEIPPVSVSGTARPEDLLGLALFVALSFVVAYTLAMKDAARDEATAARSDVEGLAATLAGERNTMRQILQQMPNGVLVVDEAGRITMQNTRSVEILGDDADTSVPTGGQVSSMPWVVHPPGGGPRTPPDAYPIVRSLEAGEIVIGERMELDRTDGSTVMIEVDSAPIRAGEAIVGAVAVFQDVTTRVATEERLAGITARLQRIQAVTDAALTGLGFDELAERLLFTVRRVLGTDSATLLLLDRTGDALREHATVGVETGETGAPVPVGEGIAGTIAATVAPLVIDDIARHRVVRHWLTDQMRSLMGVPLVYRGRVMGVIHVASRTGRQFTDDEVEILALAANRIASALERAALYDSRSAMAQALQRSLAPATLPTIRGIDLAAVYRPYSPGDEIGGDFYDVFPHGDDAWGVVVGDVSGKGPDAAAVMGLAAHTLRAIAPYEARPSSVLVALNDALLRAERVAAERFCTACEMRLRPDDGHARVTLCLAGHPRPFLIRADGDVCQVGRPGTLLGSFNDPELHDTALDLCPGDTLVSYTDGLIERRGQTIDAGEAAVRGVLADTLGSSAAEIAARLEADVLDRRDVEDDVAIVVIRKT
jgi:phosphoserine phosphatase RsbU/P